MFATPHDMKMCEVKKLTGISMEGKGRKRKEENENQWFVNKSINKT